MLDLLSPPQTALRRRVGGIAAGALAVTLVTALIGLLQPHVPVLGLGVLYVVGVLPIAIVWGLPYAVLVSIASMLAFNWFFLPPVHTFTLADSRNWFSLAAFVATGIVVSQLAARLRRQARESSLLAGIATSLLERGGVGAELERIAADAAAVLEVERASITLGGVRADAASDDEQHALTAGGKQVGAIHLAGRRRGSARARRRLLPALASLLGVAIDRERLAAEAVEAEALRRSDVIKTALLRMVSHDLRTPLMAISTSASALARDDLELDTADRADLLATIVAESERLDHIVDNLLDLSRLQAGAAEPDRRLWEVDELIVQALDELGEDGRRVDVSFPEESPQVLVDAHQIRRVLVNLLENALKYSPSDQHVRVQVGATRTEVFLRVVDRGPGVPAAETRRIFEPFQRGVGAARERGAGLGLAIAQGFAEANGGRVSLESRTDQGATFVLALPAAPAAGAVEVHP